MSNVIVKAIKDGLFSRTLTGAMESAAAASMLLRSLAYSGPNIDVISSLSNSIKAILRSEITALYFETDMNRALSRMTIIGVLFNLDRIAGACRNISTLDLDSRKMEGVYITEAADIVSKSFKAFCDMDKLAISDVQDQFKLFVASMGSKHRIALRPAVQWSFAAAINGFFTTRVIPT